MPVASAAHAYLYRASRGRVASRAGGKPVLLDSRAYERAQARSPRTFPIVVLDPQESR